MVEQDAESLFSITDLRLEAGRRSRLDARHFRREYLVDWLRVRRDMATVTFGCLSGS